LPSNQASLGALPFRFRRERVLIVGCGDVGMRLARDLGPRVRLLALTSTPARLPALRAQGILPLSGNLDDPASLRRLAALATRVVHLAPPAGGGPYAVVDRSAHAHPAARPAPAHTAALAGLRLHQRGLWRLRG
jgi:uncharacterized protein YbjT (DUF2867 family)